MRESTKALCLSLTLALAGAASAADGVTRYDGLRGSVCSLAFGSGQGPSYPGGAVGAATRFVVEVVARTGVQEDDGVSVQGLQASPFPGMLTEAVRGLAQGFEPESRVLRVDEDRAQSFVRLQQLHRGLPIEGADMVVAVSGGRTVSSYQGGLVDRPALRCGTRTVADIDEARAIAAARAAVPGASEVEVDPAELVWRLDQDGAMVLAYRVGIGTRFPIGAWNVFVAARDGRVLATENRLMASGAGAPGGAALAGPAGAEGAVTVGRGKVYKTNPLRDPSVAEVRIENLDGSGTLTSKALKVVNGKSASIQNAQGDFRVEPSSPHFAEVMAFYHLDAAYSSLRRTDPSFKAMDRQLPVEVHSPGNAFVKVDNAFYDPRKKGLFILDPKKLNDLHLESAVMVHEYHHAVTDSIVAGLGGTEGKALHEGYADYFAASQTQDSKIGEWALKPVNRPFMRDLASTRKYPADLHPQREPHSDGEIWGAACWDLHNRLGRETADFLVHKSRFYLASNATFFDAYQGILSADRDFRSGSNQAVIKEIFTARGIASGTVGGEMAPEIAQRRKYATLAFGLR